MSVAMVSMVLDCFPSGGSLRCLAIALADAADDEGGSIYKSVATLAHQCVQSERTVQRVLPTLVEGGWLEVMSSATGGRGRSTVYRIAPAWITRCAIERAQARVDGRKPARVELSGPAELSTKGDRLSPFPKTQKGDKSDEKGDKNGLKGDTHECHPNKNKERINPPYPPLTRGAVDNSDSRKPEQPKPEGRTAGEPSAPAGDGRAPALQRGHERQVPASASAADEPRQGQGPNTADQQGPGTRAPWRWRETSSGVQAMGVQLGLGPWDEAAFGVGQGEAWPVYRDRVVRAFEAQAAEDAPAIARQAARLRRSVARGEHGRGRSVLCWLG